MSKKVVVRFQLHQKMKETQGVFLSKIFITLQTLQR